MKRIALLVLAFGGLLAAFSGCRSPSDLSGLSIELVKIEHAADGSAVATLQFNNSTVRAINVASSIHQLSLNGRPAQTLVIKEPLGLAAERPAIQMITFHDSAGAIPASGSVSYKLSSTLTLVLYDDEKEQRKLNREGTVTVR